MIIDRPESHFIFILSKEHVHHGYNYIRFEDRPLTNREYLKYWGKWLIFGTRKELDILAKKLSPLVEDRKIPAVKYDREKIDAFALGECVMCVYCDARNRDAVFRELAALGVEDKAWAYEKETMERWMPGGHLLEKWIASHNLSPEEADRVRQGAVEKFDVMFGDENAVFKGVEQ